MNIKERIELVKRNTQEIVVEEELERLLKEKKIPTVYLGTAITGRPHVGYFLWVLKLADFLKAGFKVKILLADLHGALDNTPWAVLEKRYDYYEKIIPLMFEALGVKKNKNLIFVKGSEFQLAPEYMYDLLQMATHNSVRDSIKAASEVVKLGDNPKLAGLIYPMMQALDEYYLDADIQYGGIDQRKILMFARENLPKLGYKPKIEIMTPLVPGLIGKKMSASDEKSKIDLLDDEKMVKKKLQGADCVLGDPDNGVLAFLKYVLMPIKQDNKNLFIIRRDKKYGGDMKFKNYEEIEKLFVSKKLHPLDLKNAVADEISDLLKPIQKNRKMLEKYSKEAYN